MHKTTDVAVKVLSPNSLTPKEFLNEAEILFKLKDERIIQYLGFLQAEEVVYIVTELMPNGTLLDFFKTKEGRTMKLKNIIDINIQICEGMNFLEYMNISHNDLRAANLLVGMGCNIKIGDFGSASISDSDSIIRKGSYKIKWTAPEAILYKKFSSKSDVWSFGVVMYETVTLGEEPYPEKTDLEVLNLVWEGNRMLKPECHFEIPHSYYTTMLMCWDQ